LPYCPKYEALDNERLLLAMSALMKTAVKKGLVEFAGNRVIIWSTILCHPILTRHG